MTDNEIIEILQTEKACVTRAMKNECNRDCYNCDLCEEGKDILTVYDAVIKAIKENQQYKAIGTVEEFQNLKEWQVLMKERGGTEVISDMINCFMVTPKMY